MQNNIRIANSSILNSAFNEEEYFFSSENLKLEITPGIVYSIGTFLILLFYFSIYLLFLQQH